MSWAAQPADAAIVVDGLMGDWGVTPGPYSAGPSQWTPFPSVFISFVQEDQDPSVDFLGPGSGGQSYDVEAIYFAQQDTSLYLAIVSGFPLEGIPPFTAGDVAIDFGSDGSYEFGVETSSPHALYGSVVWTYPFLFPISGPTSIGSGTLLGPVSFGYQPSAYVANGHYAFEIGIPTSLFGSYSPPYGSIVDATIHWTMACGNDALDLHASQPVIPEPASSALMLMGLGGLTIVQKRRGKRSA